MEASKDVSIGITFKEAAFSFADDNAFKAVLGDTLNAVKTRIEDMRASAKASKAVAVAGVPTLAEKGVSISVGMSF